MRTIKFNEKKIIINDSKRNISINKTTTTTTIKLVNKTENPFRKAKFTFKQHKVDGYGPHQPSGPTTAIHFGPTRRYV